MLIVFLGISLAMLIAGYLMEYVFYCEGEGIMIVGIILTVICLAIIGPTWADVKNGDILDDRIAMYQTQNTEIEGQIAECVTQYQGYESGIFKSVAPKSAITLVALYPELKSDALVQQQIETYQANNATIISLRDNQIKLSVLRWWLYFGE